MERTSSPRSSHESSTEMSPLQAKPLTRRIWPALAALFARRRAIPATRPRPIVHRALRARRAGPSAKERCGG